MRLLINNSVYGQQEVEVSKVVIEWKSYQRWQVSLYDVDGVCVEVETIVLWRDVVRYLEQIGGDREWYNV